MVISSEAVCSQCVVGSAYRPATAQAVSQLADHEMTRKCAFVTGHVVHRHQSTVYGYMGDNTRIDNTNSVNEMSSMKYDCHNEIEIIRQ